MPSLESIRLPVDTSDMLKAVKASNTLERGIKQLKEAVDSGKITNDQYNLGLKELRRQNDGLFSSWQKARAEIVRYAGSLEGTTRASKALAKEQSYVEITNAQTAKSFGELVTSVNTYQTANKSAAASADTFVNQLRKQEAQAAKTASTMQQYYSKTLGVGGPAATSSGAGYGAIESELDRLSNKYNSVYRASKLYENSLNELKQAQMLGAISTKQYDAELEQLNLEFTKFSNGTASSLNRFQQQLIVSNKGMNQMGLATQQLGYQMGDFLVQVQSGTNWMVAFGQQATQAVAVLPMFATQLGLSSAALLGWATGLGIVIPLVTALGAAWMRTHEDTKKAQKGLSDMEKQIKSIDDTLKQWLQTKEAAKAGITVEEMFGLQGIDEALKKVEEAKQRLQELQSNQGFIGNYLMGGNLLSEAGAKQIEEAQKRVEEAQERLNQLKAKQLEYDQKQIANQQDQVAIAQLTLKYGEDSYRVYAKKAEIARKEFEENAKTNGVLGDQLQALMRVYDQQAKLNKEIENGKGWVDKTKDVLSDLLSMDASSAFLSSAKQAMKDLHDAAVKAAEATRNAMMAQQASAVLQPGDGSMNLPSIGGMGSVSANAPQSSPRPGQRPSSFQGDVITTSNFNTKKSRGGGGSKRDSYKTDLENLMDSLKSEQELLDSWYEEKSKILEDQRAKEILGKQGHNEALLALDEEYKQKTLEIQRSLQQEKLSAISGAFGDAAALMNTHNKKLFMIGKAAAIAQATVDGYSAAVTAWDKGMKIGGPPVAAAFTAASLAKTGSLIASIASTNYGGGSGSKGSASSSTSSAVATQTQAPQQVYVSGLTADQLFTGEQLQNLFDSLQKENKDRGYVFTVARQ